MTPIRTLVCALIIANAAPAAAQFDDDCIGRRDDAMREGLVVHVVAIDRLTATLVVDEGRWNKLPFKEKVALGETVECALIRDTSPAGADLVVRSHETRALLGTYKTGGTLTLP